MKIVSVTIIIYCVWSLYMVSANPVDPKASISCKLCAAAVGLIKELLRWGVSRDTIASRLESLCEVLHIEDGDVCDGMISAFTDEFLTSINGSRLTTAEECLVVLGSVCPESADDPALDWSVKPSHVPKPPPSNHTPRAGGPRLRILQLADIHLDRLYTPGSNANCGKPLCCQNSSGSPSEPSTKAGYWGTLYTLCDIPEHTLDNLLSHLSQHEQIDMVYWTGDLAAHDVWQQSREEEQSLLHLLTNKLLKYFPNTPIYSSLGNHESYPVDSFPPPFVTGNQSESWLYNTLAETWSHWLPKSSLDTIKYAGYYTVLVKPGFRVVSLNTNFCERTNFWLLLNVTDPGQELQWLVNVLQSAEDKQEKVHILGHIPPGVDDCLRAWSRNIKQIIVRYSDTVAGYFLAHTHYDHFELIYDPKTQKPLAVGYIAPSVTTFTGGRGINPGYRIYSVDGFYPNSTWSVLDHNTTIFNMSLANAENVTTWQLEYSAKADYKMADLSPASWHDFTTRLESDNSLFNSFYNHYYKMAASGSCDQTCKDSLICSLRTSTSGDRTYCSTLTTPYDKLDVYERSRPSAC